MVNKIEYNQEYFFDNYNRKTKMEKQENELDEIILAENVSIWSKHQSVLEKEALEELKQFEQIYQEKNNVLEEGEIREDLKNKTPFLNVEDYIRRQEEINKRQWLQKSNQLKFLAKEKCTKASRNPRKNSKIKGSFNDFESRNKKSKDTDVPIKNESGSEYVPSDEDEDCSSVKKESSKNNKKRKKTTKYGDKVIDDGVAQDYKSRLDLYYKKLIEEEEILKRLGHDEDNDYYEIKGGLKIPIIIWNKLYGYQQNAIKWLWKIHQKSMGALLGDEMGLGKTVQIIAFLCSLEYSKISSCHGRFVGLGPSLIICPATVLHQWVKHFHEWAPEFRVAVLHQSGNYQGNKGDLITNMHKSKGIILTTYLGVIKYQNHLLDYNWHYVILDEGHKIRNPAAKATLAVKLFKTPHRLLLTGSPMQNDLTELWTLFDFTNPGMLGNLKTFQQHFSGPILQGGFTNSTPMQEATAMSVATTLKQLIAPYLLRRTKNEVQDHILLPNKTEQVLFCSLSEEQKFLYKEYLLGEDVGHILGKAVKNWGADNQIRARVFVAITKLRKICNHPDIYLSEMDKSDQSPVSSSTSISNSYKKSGKMVVVSALLKIWKKQNHRVLLFTQSRSMISIFQDFLEHQGYKYLKMDGTTPITTRQPLIETFNTDSSYDVFLLTTRVGGLGVNLTGANRVIIYDPDWNPATDTQARERAWRIGQEKQVTIYRLLAAGTIEEKMYQRQVWKQLLSNKILMDPKTNKIFKSSDLFDLFSFQEGTDANPETVNIFHNSRVRIQDRLKEQANDKKKKGKKRKAEEPCFSEDKIKEMKYMAQQIAKSLSKKPTDLQIELETEKNEKRKERQEMARLEVGELLKYNKERRKVQDYSCVNKIDDCEAVVSFSEALQYSEGTAKLHHNLKHSKDIKKIVDEAKLAKQKTTKEPDKLIDKFKKKKKSDSDKKVDTSGRIDGEQIEGLVKMEIKKKKKNNFKDRDTDAGGEHQDDYILGKLFQKKGVFGAVQHDSVIQGGSQGGSLRIHTEAKLRAEKSLEALKKSRVDNWRW